MGMIGIPGRLFIVGKRPDTGRMNVNTHGFPYFTVFYSMVITDPALIGMKGAVK